jgi:hypothetical protein
MAYTTPSTAVTGGTLTTALWNTNVRDNVSYVYGWGTTLAGASGTLVNVTSTQGSVVSTQGSVASTQGSVVSLQTTVANAQGSVNTLAGSVNLIAGSVNAVSAAAQTIGTAISSAATAGSVYTLGTTDVGKILLCYGTASGTVQIPLNATQPFSIGQKVDLAQMGTGTVTVTIASGGTLDYTPSNVLRTKYSAASVVKMNTNEWLLIGDLA